MLVIAPNAGRNTRASSLVKNAKVHEGKIFYLPPAGIFDQHPVTSSQHRFALSNVIFTPSTRRFEAKLR